MKKSYLGILFLGISTLFACSQDDMQEQEVSNNVATSARIANGKIPFTVENVQNALPIVLRYYDSYNPTVSQKFRDYKVEPTHVYYKFTPADSLQYSLLMSYDDQLGLTTQPFEHEIIERNDDPSDTEIGTFYAIASIDQKIPDVPKQIVAELHFTDEDKLEDVPANYDEVEFKQNLMYQARKQAGHLDDEELAEGYMSYKEGIKSNTTNSDQRTTYGLFGKKWRPSGNVYVEDDYLTDRKGEIIYKPVVNCEVNVLKWGWLRIENGSTNNDGYFSTGTTYTDHVTYNVKFTNHFKVKVKSGNFFDVANFKSDSHKRRSLEHTFGRNTKMQFYALVNNAAWDYFNRVVPTYNINSPNTIEISAHYNGNGHSNYYFDAVPFRSEVKISRTNSAGNYRRSDGIYAVVIHELTHKAHYRMDNGAFGIFGGKSLLFLRETWAVCVETQATNDKYQSWFTEHGLGDYEASDLLNNGWEISTWRGNEQQTLVVNQDEYSEVFIDLMDNFNQNTINPALPNDNVTGYTLHQIQTALNSSRTVDQFFTRLRNLYNNSTENNLQPIQDYANTIVNSL